MASDGTEGNNHSSTSAISADGRFVAFASIASNLVPGDTSWCGTHSCTDVFVHDRETGTTERVSVASDGSEGNHLSVSPSISADGHYVAFASGATNLVPGDENADFDVFVHDRETGTTERVSVASDGTEGNGLGSSPGLSFNPTISADGRYVAFDSWASNLVPGDTNICPLTFAPVTSCRDVFVHDRETGATERVSVASDGAEGNDESFFVPWGADRSSTVISADGRYVAFESFASNLVPGDENADADVFVHDRETGTTERVSVAWDGSEGNGPRRLRSHGGLSAAAAISAGGRHVAFESVASNLVPGDGNGASDVFVRDRGPATGVVALDIQQAAGELVLSGSVTSSGVTVASADDPGKDGADPPGAEITGASITSRPELEDLLLRLRLASLPPPADDAPRPLRGLGLRPPLGGAPGVLYRWSFTAGGTDYEVRVLRAAATADPPTANPHIALYECAASCTERTQLSGGIGTTGAEVRVSLPLGTIGAEEGATLTNIEASAALGEATPGAIVVLDEVDVPDASIPVLRVDLGIAPAGTPEHQVAFSSPASLAEGLFSGSLDVSSLGPGPYDVWARSCLADSCGAASTEVTL